MDGEVTYNEYRLLITVLRILQQIPFDSRRPLGPKSRDQLSYLTGFSHDIVDKATAFFKDENGFGDNAPTHPIVHAKNKGRPFQELDKDYKDKLLAIVHAHNSEGSTNTSTTILTKLRELYHLEKNKYTLIRDLCSAGLRYQAGYRLNRDHDSATTVQRRMEYIQERLANIKIANGKWRPNLSEGFLDESYILINHSLPKAWVEAGGVVHQSGRRAMLIIFGVFVVYTDATDNKVRAKFVEDFIINWSSTGKPPLQSQEGAPRKRGRPRSNQDKWQTIPDDVKRTRTVPGTHDYHGHLNADLFEKIFAQLCVRLNELGFHGCQIHMEGAGYHVRDSTRAPSKSSSKKVMEECVKNRQARYKV